MKVRCYDNSYLEDCLTVGRIYDVKEIKENYYVIKDDKGITNLFWHGDFEIVKENEMEKTFREVIADIKEGEVWECGHILITKSNDGIELKGMSSYSSYFTDDNKIFKLQRKEYTFEEAFKAYEEGKEIENILTGLKIKASVREGWHILPIINGELEEDVCSKTLSIEEVRTKWYINN
jgi:hypothetical protein